MAVIKQDCAESGEVVVARPVLEDLDAKLQQMIDAARQTAESIIDAARVEAERLADTARRAAHDEGYEAGRVEGRAQALQDTTAQAEQTCGAWTTMLEQWESERAGQLRQAEEDLIGTAMQLAESVVHRTIEIDPTVVRGPLQAALELVRRPTDVVIRVHPDDHDFVSGMLDDVVTTLSACRSARLEADHEIERGGCRLELDGGSVDATLSTQLDRIATVLLPATEAAAG
jgi:flagellar assembly protein FliH